MSIHANELAPPRGATRNRKRLARGNSAGGGTYAGKGLKGQKSRSGSKIRLGFEGGQMPLIRRMSTLRGFNNKLARGLPAGQHRHAPGALRGRRRRHARVASQAMPVCSAICASP